MLTYQDALARWLDSIPAPLEPERLPLEGSFGRILAAEVTADLATPPFDTSAMDGWGVRLDSLGPDGGELPVSSRIAAAPSSPEPLAPGTAAKVMTGAPVPAGAEAIVPVEEADDLGDRVRLRGRPEAGAHFRRVGEVFRVGERLASAGDVVTPRLAALLAAGSPGFVEVRRRPRVAILVTGDELVPAGIRPGPGQIRNSNGPFLAAAVSAAGGEVVAAATVGDERRATVEAVGKLLGMSPVPDLVLTTGGASMGDWDQVAATLGELGAEVLFHRVSIRPAKPVLAARRGRTAILGLPGNPVSVAVAFELFARPALRRFAGLPPAATVTAILEEPLRNGGPRLAFLDARLRPAAEGFRLRPLRSRGSHDLLSHARANALVIARPESELPAGAAVEAIPLDPVEW